MDWGVPLTVYTDKGTQLVSAGEKISDNKVYLDWQKIVAKVGITWRTCPAGAQFQNGASEAVVKKAKRTFHHIYGESKLTALEMETALKRITAILGSQPLAASYKPVHGTGQGETSFQPDHR